MNISSKEAKYLLDRLSYLTVGDIVDDNMTKLFSTLFELSNKKAKVVLYVGIDSRTGKANGVVPAIKTIRLITDFGLKEAKDLYDSLDYKRLGGKIAFEVNLSEEEVLNRISKYKEQYGYSGYLPVSFE